MSNERYLFRGKRIDENRFIYGSLSVEYDGSCFISYWVPLLIDAEANSYESHQLNYQVIPETVGQFTGLVDKNGTKIFEGDQLFICAGYSSIVKFEEGMFVSVYSHPEDGETLPLSEVIGNSTEVIHDNDKAVNP